ncbi:unnamed protein product [Clonostachys rosea f. rosea IK726]|uniref:Uncharacterized protein n=1 Tax=Clonostachys rosea f. rosea IK726 TaxID=1349383 RepID=A0ACA9UB20_BIOOC|nr:unnamed protein product [Clonostachys rosea f. rosea IK726]
MYNRVIQGLRSQPGLNSGNVNIKISVSITILILFVGAMVTGGSDFLLLSRMLESAIEAMGGEDKLPRVYASDFIRTKTTRFVFMPHHSSMREGDFSSYRHKPTRSSCSTHSHIGYWITLSIVQQ